MSHFVNESSIHHSHLCKILWPLDARIQILMLINSHEFALVTTPIASMLCSIQKFFSHHYYPTLMYLVATFFFKFVVIVAFISIRPLDL
jgi:uncharacterized membrane protein